ncbi:gluconokinase [uncultured Pseudokineococcus sp.]|uniref:gluconokinase n=1 Tax=uncultured Pseudokineococcus sp. TaxID=1642928 RepID=UPI0026393C48|nr:gluconokinase [uncultured Pseudokineococcus sp.]
MRDDDPRTAAPRSADPRTAAPRSADPRTADPRSDEDGTGGAGEQVVLGVDLGTTATKVAAFTAAGDAVVESEAEYSLDEPEPGWAEQDPAAILAAAREAVRSAARQVRRRGGRVVGIGVSGAMHSLIAVGSDDEPLTPVVTWADRRATPQAERIRSGPGPEVHRRTGTPVHPMSPLPKLAWFAEERPEVAAAAAHWVGIKELLLHAWSGEWVVDHSMASGNGLLDLHALDWDAEALELAGITRAQLPRPVPVTHRLALRPEVADDLGLGRDVPLVVGGGDGPLANLGVGAVRPGVASVSIGTSGALRVVVDRPGVDPAGRTFCYALTDDLWAVGGAITNGGVVLRWVGDALAPDMEVLADELGDEPEESLTDLASLAPPGSGGLLMLPYLLSERAPYWTALPRGAYIGLQRHHRREHLVRAALEGVCQQLALVLASLREAGHEVTEVRATGGFARSAVWRQMLADVLGMDVSFPSGTQGSGYGAAVIAMTALGMVPSVEVAADRVEVSHVVRPDPAASAIYAKLLPVHAGVYDALEGVFRSLRDLDDDLPLEIGD